MCPECERLKAERDQVERRFEYARAKLERSMLASRAYRAKLKIEVTESRLYLQMADAEIERHKTLTHLRGTAVMTASRR